jgi:hypothetical protein
MVEQSKQERPADCHLPQAWAHLRSAGQEIRRSFASLVPPESRQHSRQAGREALLAARSVIDAVLSRLESPRAV